MAASIRRNILKTSVMHVFDVHRPACERFRDEFGSIGPIEIHGSPRDVASKADVVVSMVPGAPEVEHVYLNSEDGIIAASKNSHRLLIECSTIDTETARKVASQIQAAGQGTYADAPVSVRSTRSSSAFATGNRAEQHSNWFGVA